MLKKIGPYFTEDRYVALVIVLNAIVIFLLSFDTLDHLHRTFTLIDTFFIIYFLIEAILKIREKGFDAYIESNWNRFDFIIVIVSLPSLLEVFSIDLGFIFVFRILRVFRFFKFLKFVPNIDELLAGIGRAFKASVFVVLAFFIYMFLISMISCRLFKDASPLYFGDPITSLYSTFKVFTIEGWYDIPDSIATGDNWVKNLFIKLYFVILVMSGGVLGMSIVNAIFVDEMVSDNNDELMAKVKEMDVKMDLIIQQLKERDPNIKT